MWAFEHAGIVPDVVVHREGDRQRPAALGDRRRRASSRSAGAAARTARRSAATRSRARRASPSSRRSATSASSRTPSRAARSCAPGLGRIAAEDDRIGDIRGPGLMIGVEFVRDRATREPDGDAARPAERGLRRRRAARPDLRVASTRSMRWIPPLDVTAAEISEAVEIFGETLAAIRPTDRARRAPVGSLDRLDPGQDLRSLGLVFGRR